MKPSTIAEYLEALYRPQDIDSTIARLQQEIARLDQLPDDPYPQTAYARECLARALDDIGDYCGAALLLERAIELHRMHGNGVTNDTVRCLDFLGRYYLWTGRSYEAEATLFEALTIVDHLPIERQGGRGFVLVDLAEMHSRCGEHDAASSALHQAAREMLYYFGYGDAHIAFVFLHLSFGYARQQKPAIAERATKKAIRMYHFDGNLEEVRYAALLSWRGVLERQLGRIDEAKASQAEALAILERTARGHYFTERVRCRLAKLNQS